jgi:hypothetical protein
LLWHTADFTPKFVQYEKTGYPKDARDLSKPQTEHIFAAFLPLKE